MGIKPDKLNIREPNNEAGMFQEFRDVCQMEGIDVSKAIRIMMKNAIINFKNPSNS